MENPKEVAGPEEVAGEKRKLELEKEERELKRLKEEQSIRDKNTAAFRNIKYVFQNPASFHPTPTICKTSKNANEGLSPFSLNGKTLSIR